VSSLRLPPQPYTPQLRQHHQHPCAKPNRESDFDADQVALRVSRREDGILTQSARMLRLSGE
jgi:hypothetical protein